MIPELFNYWLTDRRGCELIDASTTQFLEALEETWSREILDRLALPFGILPGIHPPGTALGPPLPSALEEVGLAGVPVIAPACPGRKNRSPACCPSSTCRRLAGRSWSRLPVW